MAISVVQTGGGATVASALSLANVGYTTAAGNDIVAVAWGLVAGGLAPNPLFYDGANNKNWKTFSQVNGSLWVALGWVHAALVTSLANITVRNPNAGSIAINALEVSGVMSTIDGPVGANGLASTARQSGNVRAIRNQELMIAVGADSGALSLPTGFTSIYNSAAPFGYAAYSLLTAAQQSNPSFGTSTGNWAALQLGLRQSQPTGGRTDFQVQSPASAIRAGVMTLLTGIPCSLVEMSVTNTTASTRWLQMFNANTTAGILLGSTLPDQEYEIPANSQVNVPISEDGIPFTNGIVIAATTTESGPYIANAGDVLTFPQWAG